MTDAAGNCILTPSDCTYLPANITPTLPLCDDWEELLATSQGYGHNLNVDLSGLPLSRGSRVRAPSLQGSSPQIITDPTQQVAYQPTSAYGFGIFGQNSPIDEADPEETTEPVAPIGGGGGGGTMLGPGGTEQTPTDILSLPTQTTVSDNRPIGKILLIGVIGIALYSVLTKN